MITSSSSLLSVQSVTPTYSVPPTRACSRTLVPHLQSTQPGHQVTTSEVCALQGFITEQQRLSVLARFCRRWPYKALLQSSKSLQCKMLQTMATSLDACACCTFYKMQLKLSRQGLPWPGEGPFIDKENFLSSEAYLGVSMHVQL